MPNGTNNFTTGDQAKPSSASAFQTLLSHHYKLAAGVVCAAILAGSYYFLLRPKYEEVQRGGEYDRQALIQQRDVLKMNLAQVQQFVNAAQRVNQADVQKLRDVLPSDKGVADLFVQLQALTEENGFVMKSLSITDTGNRGKKTGVAGVERLSLTLNVRGGDYLAFKRLLERIETNLRLMDVNAVYFTPGSPDYTINIFTYYTAS